MAVGGRQSSQLGRLPNAFAHFLERRTGLAPSLRQPEEIAHCPFDHMQGINAVQSNILAHSLFQLAPQRTNVLCMMPDWLITHQLTVMQIAATGAVSTERTEPIRNIVHRAPISTKQFVEDHKKVFS